MALMKLTIISAQAHSASALVDYNLDGMELGVECVPSLSLAMLTGCWDDPEDMVGRVFEREVQ